MLALLSQVARLGSCWKSPFALTGWQPMSSMGAARCRIDPMFSVPTPNFANENLLDLSENEGFRPEGSVNRPISGGMNLNLSDEQAVALERGYTTSLRTTVIGSRRAFALGERSCISSDPNR